ncbi:MAG: orotate phosphoribosyltransferase [Candidatus Omnitrophica bacterium]|nr:orotate phosphoribosyltransferase [Candidatus Omnitrophota bacterium]MCM8832196.1 orotate phosphoribosyltransferase [Candidatus Omnitrophota bacterium]
MRERLFELLKKEAILERKVKLSSGRISNFYIDARRVSLSSEGIYLISHLVWDLIKKEDITAIGGPTLGADPIVAGVCMVAHTFKKKLKGFLIRKAPKEHGLGQLIEGKELTTEDKVVVVDDVATSGYSLVNAVEVLHKQKIKVYKAIVVVDRQEGAEENLLKVNCPLISIFKKKDFIDK